MNQPPQRIGPVVFGGLARRITGARWVALALCLAMTLATGWAAVTRLQFDNSTEGLLGSDSPAMATLDELGDQFGQDKVYLIAAEGDVFSTEFMTRLTALHRRVADLRLDLDTLGMRREERRAVVRSPQDLQGHAHGGHGHVVHAVTSLVNASELRPSEHGIERHQLFDPLPSSEQLAELRGSVLSNPSLVDRVVSGNGRMAILVVRTDFMSEADAAVVYDALQDILRESSDDTFALRLTGTAALEVALNRAIVRDITVVVGACLVAMLAILAFLFRSLFGVVAPLLVVLQAAVWTLGAMALSGVPVTSVTSVLASFLICVGMADSIHVQTVFRDLRRDGATPREAVVEAVGLTGVPVLMTSLTTIAALLSFRTTSFGAVVDMGTFGAVGAAAVTVLTLVFLPAFLTLHGGSALGARAAARSSQPDTQDALDRLLARFDGASRPTFVDGRPRYWRRNVTLLIAAAIAVASGFGLARLDARHDPLTWLPVDDEARVSLEAVDSVMGGTAIVQMLITAPRGQTLLHHDVMRRLEQLEAHALAYRAPGREDERVVTNVSSVLNVLRQGLRARSDDPDTYGLPTSEQGIVDLYAQVLAAGGQPPRQLITPDARHALMTLRVHWMEANEYAPLERHLNQGIREYIGASAHVELTGSVYANFEIVSALIENLVKSFATALAVIALLMVLMLGDFKLGIIAMLPNVLPIMVVGGVLGALEIPFDLNTLLVASIAIGIAVDDTIHFFYMFHANQPTLGTEGAIAKSFQQTARAVVSTTAVLAIGFSSYAFAEMDTVRRFGLMIASCVVVSLLAELVLTPALLRAVYGRSGSSANA